MKHYDDLTNRMRNGTKLPMVSALLNEGADAIEELSKPKWIPVTERLPEYGTTVLVYGSQGGIYTARYERARTEWGRDSWWKLNSKSHICNPTHWMPLPPAPKESNQ